MVSNSWMEIVTLSKFPFRRRLSVEMCGANSVIVL